MIGIHRKMNIPKNISSTQTLNVEKNTNEKWIVAEKVEKREVKTSIILQSQKSSNQISFPSPKTSYEQIKNEQNNDNYKPKVEQQVLKKGVHFQEEQIIDAQFPNFVNLPHENTVKYSINPPKSKKSLYSEQQNQNKYESFEQSQENQQHQNIHDNLSNYMFDDNLNTSKQRKYKMLQSIQPVPDKLILPENQKVQTPFFNSSKQVNSPKNKSSKVSTFLQTQRKKISEQRKKTLTISKQFHHVFHTSQPGFINGQNLGQSPTKSEILNDLQQDFESCLQYFLSEVIDLYTISELLKYNLKFKGYQILTKIYAYRNNVEAFDDLKGINLKENIKMYDFHTLVCKMMPNCQKSQIDLVIFNIFGDRTELTYQQFNQALRTGLTDRTAQKLSDPTLNLPNSRTSQLVMRLFATWIQLKYFQDRIKNILKSNVQQMQFFIQSVSSDHQISNLLIIQYLKNGEEAIRAKNRLIRVQIYLEKIMGSNRNQQNFMKWVYSQ